MITIYFIILLLILVLYSLFLILESLLEDTEEYFTGTFSDGSAPQITGKPHDYFY